MTKFSISNLLEKALSPGFEPEDLMELFSRKSDEYGISVTHARELLGIEYRALTNILKGKAKQPNLFDVLKIADYLDIDFNDFLANLVSQQNSDNVSKLDEARKASFLAKNFDIDRLYSDGFFQEKGDAKAMVNRILTFFGFDSIKEYEEFSEKIGKTVFSRTKRTFVDKMRHFSVNSAYRLFERINNPHPYDREELMDLIPKIKPLSQNEENGLYTVCRALFEKGVTVIFQKHLTTSQYRGATMFVNDKPCIVITDLNQRYSTLWFALMHELYHVLFDEEDIKSDGYHLTNDKEIQMSLIDEDAANQFAGDYFVNLDELKYIIPHINNHSFVERFAKKIKVHPAIIYSTYQFYMHDKKKQNKWGYFKKYMPKIENSVQKLNPISWQADSSISEIADNLKEIFDLKPEYERKAK